MPLTDAQESAADAAALAWVRRLLAEPQLDPFALDLSDYRRDLYRLASDGWRAWTLEHRHQLKPNRWRAPYICAAEGRELSESSPWAAPLCINAALRIWRQRPDYLKPSWTVAEAEEE